MNDKPLTVQQVLAVLCGILVFGSALWLIADLLNPIRPSIGAILAVICGLGVVRLIACISWHRRVCHREDLQPDLLAQLIPPDLPAPLMGRLLQLGAAHVSVLISQRQGTLRLVVIAQNCYEADARIELGFKVKKGHEAFGSELPALETYLPPAALVLAMLNMPLRPLFCPLHLSLKPDGDCSINGFGRKVRFARRPVLQPEVPGCLTVAALFAGALVFGGGRTFEVELQPCEGHDGTHTYADWETVVLWTPEKQVPTDELAAAIRAALYGPG